MGEQTLLQLRSLDPLPGALGLFPTWSFLGVPGSHRQPFFKQFLGSLLQGCFFKLTFQNPQI